VRKQMPNIIAICIYEKDCHFKSLKNNGSLHGWKKSLYVCNFEDTCNQKRVMDHIGASRKYGVLK